MKSCPYRYKIGKMCDGTVDNCLGELKFSSWWAFYK